MEYAKHTGLRGKVQWFDKKKGFGFITNPEGKQVFVHHSVIEGHGFRSLKDGEAVEFDEEDGPKGYKALRVRRLSQETPTSPPSTPKPSLDPTNP